MDRASHSHHGGIVMTATQSDKATRFRALHEAPGAFVIPNPWDAGSARVLAGLGFQALATSSGASAGILGRRDGKVTRDEALAHARAIVEATDLPVVGGSREGFRRRAGGGGGDHPSRRRGGAGRRLDRGRDRRQGQAALRHRPRHRARGGGRAGGARAPVSVHAHRAHRELPARQPGSRRHDPAPAGLREGRRRRALRARSARPRGGACRVRGRVEAVQLHGRHQGASRSRWPS